MLANISRTRRSQLSRRRSKIKIIRKTIFWTAKTEKSATEWKNRCGRQVETADWGSARGKSTKVKHCEVKFTFWKSRFWQELTKSDWKAETTDFWKVTSRTGYSLWSSEYLLKTLLSWKSGRRGCWASDHCLMGGQFSKSWDLRIQRKDFTLTWTKASSEKPESEIQAHAEQETTEKAQKEGMLQLYRASTISPKAKQAQALTRRSRSCTGGSCLHPPATRRSSKARRKVLKYITKAHLVGIARGRTCWRSWTRLSHRIRLPLIL